MSLQTLFAIFLIFLVFNAGSAFAQTDEIRYQIITDVNCQSRTTSAIADDVVEEYFALSKIKHIASPLECGARDVKIDENLQSNDLIILIMEDPTFVLSSDDLSLIDNHGNTKYYEKGKKHILFVRSNPLDDHSTFFDLSHALSHFVSKINNQPDSISIDMANRIFHELNSCKKDLYPFYNQFKDCPQDMYSILQIMSISYGDNMYVAETPHPESAKINNDTESIMQTSSNELERYLPDVNNIKITKNMDDIIEFSYESGISHIGGSITKYETIEQENSNFAAAVVLSDLKVDYNRYDKVDCASGKILSKNVLVCKKDRYHIVMRTDEDIDLEQPMVQMLGKLGANHRNTGAYDKTPTISKGGCLIATAAYGTEMSSQVQLLREIRDNVLFGTDSGTTFMVSFDQFYYTFSPGVADLERQSPIFKEIVKIAITPMLSTLSILNYVNIDSEYEMLGFGIGIIILNAGIYLVIPAIIIVKLRQKLCR
ncbi:MAG: hypothetical protein HZA84_04090 [Thaumarchaeota archaeon]|nr:hypothetical protein [Nitrososphaerota archaeon]